MVAHSVSLVDGEREFLLHRAVPPRRDVILTSLDAPSPGVRAATQDRPDTDGTDDSTRRHSGRAVSAEVVLLDEPARLVDELNAFLHPAARPYLVIDDEEWGVRRLRLRCDQFSAPLPRESHLFVNHQMQWQAPDGVWEAADPVEVGVNAAGGTTAGISFPTGFPWVFQATAGVGQVLHTNPGSTWSDQAVRLYGPCVGPRWSNDATGEMIAFSEDLVVPLGEYVEVNTRDRTAYYLSDPNADRLGYLDFDLSTWWRVPPGDSQLRYHPTAEVDAGCMAVMSYRPAWL